jgi:hypothetical protein
MYSPLALAAGIAMRYVPVESLFPVKVSALGAALTTTSAPTTATPLSLVT